MMALWELHGVGQVERRIVGDIAAIKQSARMSSVIGAWDQYRLINILDELVKSGFVVYWVRRLEAPHWDVDTAREMGSEPPVGKDVRPQPAFAAARAGRAKPAR
jgi:hypothetical protein